MQYPNTDIYITIFIVFYHGIQTSRKVRKKNKTYPPILGSWWRINLHHFSLQGAFGLVERNIFHNNRILPSTVRIYGGEPHWRRDAGSEWKKGVGSDEGRTQEGA